MYGLPLVPRDVRVASGPHDVRVASSSGALVAVETVVMVTVWLPCDMHVSAMCEL